MSEHHTGPRPLAEGEHSEWHSNEEYGYDWIRGRECEITLSTRPFY